jgi:hypothetical protein
MSRSQLDEPRDTEGTLVDIATRLLELQQRLSAFDSLYNEEITSLRDELSRLKVDFLRSYKAQAPSAPGAAKQPRSRRGGKTSRTPRETSKQQPDRSSAQKE